jgi:type III secretory pathway component EscR
MSEKNENLEKVLEQYIDNGIFEKIENDSKFKFTEKGAKLYTEYLLKFSHSVKNHSDTKEQALMFLTEEELVKVVHAGLLKIYNDNMPAIFVHVLDKANQIGFENYVKFELCEPKSSETFH